jgi:hypothetical protein
MAGIKVGPSKRDAGAYKDLVYTEYRSRRALLWLVGGTAGTKMNGC